MFLPIIQRARVCSKRERERERERERDGKRNTERKRRERNTKREMGREIQSAALKTKCHTVWKMISDFPP